MITTTIMHRSRNEYRFLNLNVIINLVITREKISRLGENILTSDDLFIDTSSCDFLCLKYNSFFYCMGRAQIKIIATTKINFQIVWQQTLWLQWEKFTDPIFLLLRIILHTLKCADKFNF